MLVMNNKKRIFRLLKLFYTQSDEQHPLTTPGIIKEINNQGLTIDRKTLADDIKFLTGEGINIVTIKSSPNKYYWEDRPFEEAELCLLIDAVSSSRFIGTRKAHTLCQKLLSLSSLHQQENLQRHIKHTGKGAADSKELYKTVNSITSAINDKKIIKFKYFEYNGNKQKKYRGQAAGGDVYELSPYCLYWNEDFYYAVGWSDKHDNVSAFRIDRMEGVRRTNRRARPKPKDFCIEDYASKIFSMFAGEEATCTLECRNELMKDVIDRFGIDVKTKLSPGSDPDKPEDTFIAKVQVELSPTFYAWVFQFGGGIKIVGPEEAVDGYEDMRNEGQSNGYRNH